MSTPTIITFNTGRLYTAYGQRIAACWDHGEICFYDVDRGIQGVINEQTVREHRLELKERDIMKAYDYELCAYWIGTYQHDRQEDVFPLLRQAALAETSRG